MVLLPGCGCCQTECGWPRNDTPPSYVELDVLSPAFSATVQGRRTGEPGRPESSVSSTLSSLGWTGTYQLSRVGTLQIYRYQTAEVSLEVIREDVFGTTAPPQRRLRLRVVPGLTWTATDPRTTGSSTPTVTQLFNSAFPQILCNPATNSVSYSCSFSAAGGGIGSSFSPGVSVFGSTQTVPASANPAAGSACFVPLSLQSDMEVVFFTSRTGESLITDSTTFTSQFFTPNWTGVSDAYRFRISLNWSVQAVRFFYGTDVVPGFSG